MRIMALINYINVVGTNRKTPQSLAPKDRDLRNSRLLHPPQPKDETTPLTYHPVTDIA